jgi:hypothetical protein
MKTMNALHALWCYENKKFADINTHPLVRERLPFWLAVTSALSGVLVGLLTAWILQEIAGLSRILGCF